MTLKKVLVSAFAGILMVSAAPASAIIIDSFQTGTSETTARNTGTSVFSQTSGAGIIGGQRDIRMTINADNNTDDISAGRFGVGGGHLIFNNDLGINSTLSVLWDGSGDNAMTNEFGLGGVDLTDGGATSGLVFTATADHDALITVTFYEDANNFSTGTLSLIGNGTEQTVTQLFGGLVNTMSGATLSAVNAIELSINSNGAIQDLDLRLAGLGTPAAPEPSALALIGLAAIGGAFWRRKRT